MIALIAVSMIAGILIGIAVGSDTNTSDYTIGRALDVIGDVYDNSMTLKFEDYEELCKRVWELRRNDDRRKRN